MTSPSDSLKAIQSERIPNLVPVLGKPAAQTPNRCLCHRRCHENRRERKAWRRGSEQRSSPWLKLWGEQEGNQLERKVSS